jgi:hypothetical protein
MREEDVVDDLDRNLHRHQVLERTVPKVKNRLPFPNSTIMQVPTCERVGGTGVLPMKEMRISSSPSS